MNYSDKPHKRLECWKRSVDFVTRVYHITASFPVDERFGLTSQIRRATVSIPCNIAEGAGRKSNKEFLNFLSISQGSVSEADTLFIVAANLGFLKEGELESILEELDLIGKIIHGLMTKIRSSL